MRETRGSAAVLLTAVFAALLVLVACLFTAAQHAAGVAFADAAFRSAGRSILSEYDTGLMDRYGICAFRGDERQMERDIAFYANASMKKDKTAWFPFVPSGKKTRVIDMEAADVEANLKAFSIMDVNILEGQLRDAVAGKTLDSLTRGSGKKDFSDPNSGHKNRTLRKDSVKEGLPSADIGWSFPDISSLSPGNLSKLAEQASSDMLTSQYILSVFNHANDGLASSDTFFDNEAEYILSGRMNDKENYTNVVVKLSIIRMIANNAAIYTDPKKLAQIEELAAPFAAAFVVGEEVARVMITEIWAGAETQNDIKLFEAGKKVAFLKSPSQWALTDGGKVLEGLFASETVVPANVSGASYDDYLRILLLLMDRETKLLRVMDLIQINMKGTYNGEFLMREYYAGFRFGASVNNVRFEYTERY
jgi:hypothetical protein